MKLISNSRLNTDAVLFIHFMSLFSSPFTLDKQNKLGHKRELSWTKERQEKNRDCFTGLFSSRHEPVSHATSPSYYYSLRHQN